MPAFPKTIPRLNPMMACDTAFRIVARRALADLTANHEATCKADAPALHQMRITLTRLRTAISFFSPMVADLERTRIRTELKWLHGQLGVVRDLDVAIERLEAADGQSPETSPDHRSLNAKRADGHRRLARALRSIRYRRMIKNTSDWIENGPWSIEKGTQAARQRASPLAAYCVDKLARWQRKLLKKSRKLPDMSAKQRHRLRLKNKKLSYSIEFLADLSSETGFSGQQAALKQLRKAQKSLGQLNDDAEGRALAAALQLDGVRAPLQLLGRKHEQRLLRTAVAAYRKLAALQP
jgi:CHAD domain-containing protein